MSNIAATIEVLFEKVEDYARTTVELAKLKVIDTAADFLSSLLSRLAIAIVFAMFILLLSFGVSIYIGEILDNLYYGFFITASFYLLLSIILYACKNKWIKTPISNSLITKMLKNR